MTDDNIALAGELALGLLDGQERADALRRLLSEPAFAREVGWWRDRLSGLALAVPEAEGAPALADFDLASGQDNDRPRDGQDNDRSRGPWPWVAALTSVAAVAAITLLLTRPAVVLPVPVPQPTPTSFVAALAPAGSNSFGAVYDAGAARLRLMSAPSHGRTQQPVAWLIVGTAPPRAIGALRPGGDVIVPTALRPLVTSGATIAISLEPADRPIGAAPVGPVIASGALERYG